MDTRNVIAAISLSAAVIILYSLFFAEPPNTKPNLSENKKIEQNTDMPILDQKETLVQISREDALNESQRVKFENQSIIESKDNATRVSLLIKLLQNSIFSDNKSIHYIN